MSEEIKYQIAISHVPGIGPILAKNLIQTIGSASEVMKTKVSILQKIVGVGLIKAKSIASFNEYSWIEDELKFIEKHQIKCLFFQDQHYPYRLKQCIDSPVMLYYKGEADLNNTKVISIVGRRKNTEYGRKITEDLLEKLKEHQPLIISGLAVGIDIIAHKAAIQQKLPTIGVLAHGLDRIYPTNHRGTAKEMVLNGGLLTEYISGTNPDKQNFPMRNRIVAGLADATIVIETDVKGGSMITANLANGYNREVLAYPGSIYSNASSGCHHLIKTLKANIITDANDIVELLNWDTTTKKVKPTQRELFIELSDDEKVIYKLLSTHEQLSIDEITFGSKLNPSQIAAAILGLEMQNIITMLPGKIYKIF
ncbi:MAG: DNA-processing protein DprA [Chitinophagaceae bacterium]|nr:DNA-processing protein DprA [Chitinophagaceae bacterium]